MKSDDQTLQVEIPIAPVNGHMRGQRRSSSVPKAPDPPSIPRIARMMALAIKFQDMIDRGEVRDYADLARLGYVSRARITQIMNLLNLAPNIQEEILLRLGTSKVVRETHLRLVTSEVSWPHQRELWNRMSPSEQ
jgi:hypothetical protein